MQASRRPLYIVTGIIVVGLILFALFRDSGRGSAPEGEKGATTGMARRGGLSGADAGAAAGAAGEWIGDPSSVATRPIGRAPTQAFEQAKVSALKTWRFELETKLRQCLPPPKGEPRPLVVGCTLKHDPMLSSPALQRFVVLGVDVMNQEVPISKEIRACLNQAVGTSANLTVPADQLPDEQAPLQDVVILPI